MPARGGYALRGRWLRPEYARLRNAAWLVRNARRVEGLNPVSLQLVVQEAERLAAEGEPLGDIFEAFAELLLSK